MKKIKLLAALALASAAFAVSAQNIATVNGKPIPKSLQDEWIICRIRSYWSSSVH